MQNEGVIHAAIDLIETVPGYNQMALVLRRLRILFVPDLPDRGQLSLFHVLRLGPEPFVGPEDFVLVSLAGTLVHEFAHTRQNPFLKTLSFWQGIFTRTDPMRRYERPAYQSQIAFLHALAAYCAPFRSLALAEADSVLQSFEFHYGPME